MKIYIGYKYRHLQDKDGLKADLQELSDFLTDMGHQVFILGRDVQNWSDHAGSRWITFKDIVKNIRKHDLFFIYINSDARTNGIPVEALLAKINGLKIVLARKNVNKPYFLEKLVSNKFVFENFADLKEKAIKYL